LPGAGPSVLFNQPGINDDRPSLFPSDSTGAIGPAHYVEVVNSKIGVYDRRNLSLVASGLLDYDFTNYGGFVDPQIQWDQQAQRWLYLGIGPGTLDYNYSLAYGWSKTADPTDVKSTDGTVGWCQYVLPTASTPGQFVLDDYPKLGHSDTQLIFGTNMFTGVFGPIDQGARIWAVPKPTPGATSCPQAPVASAFGDPDHPLMTADGHRAATPVPTNTIEATDKGYVVAADNPLVVNQGGSASQIMAWHVSTPPTGPPVLVADGNMDVSSYSIPPEVTQPGGQTIDTFPDARLTQAVVHGDPDAGGAKAVWTQHTVAGAGGRTEVRWYELLPATQAVRQQGTVASSLHFVFNAAISSTRRGNEAAIFYNLASSQQVPQIGARSRQSSTPLGAMSGETILGTSPAAYTCNGDNCRWGDYSGASPDPKNAHAIWGTNQLAGPPTTTDNWTTRNFAVSTRRPRRAKFEDGLIIHPTT
jgi:hypothetical protein